MRNHCFILIIALLAIASPTLAQDEVDVVLHADERLQALINSTKMPPNAPTQKTPSKTEPTFKERPARKVITDNNVVISNINYKAPTPAKASNMSNVNIAAALKPSLHAKDASTKSEELPKDAIHHNVLGTSRGGKYTGMGYRVQIYCGPDRNRALKIKADFMRQFPGVPTYFLYTLPVYRIKVGDYKRREEAQGVYNEASGSYSPCMIVPDKINIK